jgi:hypothetical protein
MKQLAEAADRNQVMPKTHPFTFIGIALGLLVATFTGCVVHRQVQLMPRDSGTIYIGTMQGSFGSGSMTVVIDGRTYTGPAVVTGSNESFGFFQAYGGGRTVIGVSESVASSVTLKAILASTDGHGLRCDIAGDGNGHGSAICVDDKGRIYDGVISH